MSTAIDNVSLPLGAGSLPATTVLTVAGQSTSGGSCGTFDLGGFSQTVAGISGGGISGGGSTYGTIANSGTTDAVLTVAGTSEFDGVLADGATNKLGLCVSGGSLTLAGPNTFTGPTTVNAGTLQVGNGTSGETLLSPTITMSNNATAAFNHADSLVYVGSISGSGGLVKSGGGRLTLVGSQTYSGATSIANGTLGLTAASIANPSFASPVIAANSATDGFSRTSFAWAASGGARGDVLLENGGGDGYGFTAAPSGNQACIIKGTGSISQVVDFSGAGAYPLTWFGEGRGNWDLPNAIEVLLDGVQMGAIITPPTTAWSSYTTILNVATAGTHTIEFLGTTTAYSGDDSTAIDNISLPSGGPLPATTALTVAGQSSVGGPSGTFDLGGLNQTLAGITGGGISGGGTAYGKITNSGVADAVLTVTGTNQFDGVLCDGATNKLGLYVNGGSLTLAGPNTFTGATTVNGGTLQIGNGTSGKGLASPTVAMSNNATVAFNHADALLYAGSISGSGSLVKNGGGTLTLMGSQAYSGATTIVNGTLRLAAAPSLVNPSFASPALGANSMGYLGVRAEGTDFAWATAGNLANGPGPVLENACTAWGFTTPYPVGVQACVLQDDASISQTVNFPAAGAYPLAWFAEGRPSNNQANPIEVLLDGVQMGAAITPSQTAWNSYTTVLDVATAGTHTIEFLGTTPESTDLSTAINNVFLPSSGSLPATTVLTVAGQATVGGPSGIFDLGGFSQTVAGIAGGGILRRRNKVWHDYQQRQRQRRPDRRGHEPIRRRAGRRSDQ